MSFRFVVRILYDRGTENAWVQAKKNICVYFDSFYVIEALLRHSFLANDAAIINIRSIAILKRSCKPPPLFLELSLHFLCLLKVDGYFKNLFKTINYERLQILGVVLNNDKSSSFFEGDSNPFILAVHLVRFMALAHGLFPQEVVTISLLPARQNEKKHCPG